MSPEHRQAFEQLCEEFVDVFSQDSGDLGKTPLMKMEIPTGDKPPNESTPIRVSAETRTVGTGGNRNAGKGRGDYEEYLSMGQSP